MGYVTKSGPGRRYLYYKESKRVGKKMTTPVSIYLGPATAASTGIKLAALLGTNHRGTRDKMFGGVDLEARREAEVPTIIAGLTVAKGFTQADFDNEAMSQKSASSADATLSASDPTSEQPSESGDSTGEEG